MRTLQYVAVEAVVFDWDLTLWNSWDIHLWLLDSTADALDRPRPLEADVAWQYSRPFLKHLSWFFGDDQDRAVAIYLAKYRETVSQMGHLYDGVEETLRALKEGGLLLAVFSDKRWEFGVSELEQTGIGHLLDYVLFLGDGRPYKPSPRGLLEVVAGPWGFQPGGACTLETTNKT